MLSAFGGGGGSLSLRRYWCWWCGVVVAVVVVVVVDVVVVGRLVFVVVVVAAVVVTFLCAAAFACRLNRGPGKPSLHLFSSTRTCRIKQSFLPPLGIGAACLHDILCRTKKELKWYDLESTGRAKRVNGRLLLGVRLFMNKPTSDRASAVGGVDKLKALANQRMSISRFVFVFVLWWFC